MSHTPGPSVSSAPRLEHWVETGLPFHAEAAAGAGAQPQASPGPCSAWGCGQLSRAWPPAALASPPFAQLLLCRLQPCPGGRDQEQCGDTPRVGCGLVPWRSQLLSLLGSETVLLFSKRSPWRGCSVGASSLFKMASSLSRPAQITRVPLWQVPRELGYLGPSRTSKPQASVRAVRAAAATLQSLAVPWEQPWEPLCSRRLTGQQGPRRAPGHPGRVLAGNSGVLAEAQHGL